MDEPQLSSQPAPAQTPPPTLPMQLAGFKELAGRAWQLYRYLFPRIWPLLLAIFVIGTAVPNLVSFFAKDNISGAALALFESSLGLMAGFLTAVIFPIAVFLFLKAQADQENVAPTLSSVLSASIKLIGPFSVVLILSGLVEIGGFLVLIIPAIIFSVWLSMTTIALVVEGKRRFDALVRSAGLVVGVSWQVFVRFAAMSIAVMVVSFLLNLPAYLMGGVKLFSQFPRNIISPQNDSSFDAGIFQKEVTQAAEGAISLANAWSHLTSLLIGLFAIAFSFALYENLRALKGDAMAEDKRGLFKIFAVLGIVTLGLLFVAIGVLIARFGPQLGV